MKIKDLFIIILKVIGLFFVKNFLDSVVAFFSIIVFPNNFNPLSGYFESLFLMLLISGVYFLIVYVLLFKTDWVIEKLRLDKGFSQEEININIHRSVILRIGLIVLGGTIILNEVPAMLKLIISKLDINAPSHNPSIAFSLCKLIIGFILIYYQQTIVNFIELKRKK